LQGLLHKFHKEVRLVYKKHEDGYLTSFEKLNFAVIPDTENRTTGNGEK